MRFGLALLGIVLAWTACGAPPCPTPRMKPRDAEAARAPDAAMRRALFDDLVATIERGHQFADAAFARRLGVPTTQGLARARWREGLEALRLEVERSETREQLVMALIHLNASLLDGHCRFRPSQSTPPRLLPVHLRWVPGDPGQMVVESSRDPRVRVGDVIVRFDGRSLAELLTAEQFAMPTSSPRALARSLVSLLDRGLSTTPSAQTSIRVQVERGDARIELDLPFESASSTRSSRSPDEPLPSVACDPAIAYGHGYALSSVGIQTCIYQSTSSEYAALPIVRYRSFRYPGDDPVALMVAERSFLDAMLSGMPRVDGIVLDVRENHGGFNPYTFTDFFTTRPYAHHFVRVALHPDMSVQGLREATGEAMASAMLERAQRGETAWTFPFLASEDAGPMHTPSGTLRVVAAGTPVAVLTGPDCVSSCDTLTSWFARDALGPVLGEEPALAFTTVRLGTEVRLGTWGTLGTFQIALSSETHGPSGPEVEGATYPIELVLEDAANHDTYAAVLVERARGSLARFRAR